MLRIDDRACQHAAIAHGDEQERHATGHRLGPVIAIENLVGADPQHGSERLARRRRRAERREHGDGELHEAWASAEGFHGYGNQPDVLLKQHGSSPVAERNPAERSEQKSGTDRRMARERQLAAGCEDSKPAQCPRITRRQHEHRFGEAHLACDLLHDLAGQISAVEKHCERVSTEAAVGEYIERVEFQQSAHVPLPLPPAGEGWGEGALPLPLAGEGRGEGSLPLPVGGERVAVGGRGEGGSYS